MTRRDNTFDTKDSTSTRETDAKPWGNTGETDKKGENKPLSVNWGSGTRYLDVRFREGEGDTTLIFESGMRL